MIWENIEYVVSSNGNAVGFWGDTLGTVVNFQNAFERYIRVKFSQSNTMANLGEYISNIRVWECDQFGNLINIISYKRNYEHKVYTSFTLKRYSCFSRNGSTSICWKETIC